MNRLRLFAWLRDVAAFGVVGLFMAPLFWWGLTSLKPEAAIFDTSQLLHVDLDAAIANYAATISDHAVAALDARGAFADTVLVAGGSALLATLVALPAAFGLSRYPPRRVNDVVAAIFFFRLLPPIAIVVPAVFLMTQIGLFNTRLGLIIMHAVMNLPFAALMLKSFLDEVPQDIDDAARLDGASGFQIFARIVAPMAKGGIAATALLCFIFSWTEFMMSLFLTVSFRTLPVKLIVLESGGWGMLAALGTATMAPVFVFILFAQRFLVRGLSLGLQK